VLYQLSYCGEPESASGIPAVIPIVRAPDDPGVDDGPVRDEFADQISPPQAQAGGWRGFLSRWGA
jgi:HemY protein